ncbi:hypothetical protein D9M70_560480 [compost metagenome]
MSQACADQVLHFFQIPPQSVTFQRSVHLLDPQLHAHNGRLQVVGNGRQQLHAFLQVGADTPLQGIEGTGGVSHFVRAALVEFRAGGVGVEVVDGLCQAGQRANRRAHCQPGAEQQQQ